MRSCFPSLNPMGEKWDFNISLWNIGLARLKGLHSSRPKAQSHEVRLLSPDRLHSDEQGQSWRGVSSAHSTAGPLVLWKNTGQGARCLPSALRRPSTSLCPWVSRLTSLGGWRFAPSLYANTARLWTGAPTSSPVLCIPGLISSSQRPRVAGIPTRWSESRRQAFQPWVFSLKPARLCTSSVWFCPCCVPFADWNTLILKGKYISLPRKEYQYHWPPREGKVKARDKTVV